MKVNMTTPLKSFSGEILKEGDEEIVLRQIVINALMVDDSQDRTPAEEKFNRYMLAQRVHNDDEVELTAEEVSRVKSLIGKFFNPLVVGAAWNILDPKTTSN